jgi:uncharacterized repeat protein (TIGR03803 family)
LHLEEESLKRFSFCLVVIMGVLFSSSAAQRAVVIDGSDRVRLPGRVHSSIPSESDIGPASPTLQIPQMSLTLAPWPQGYAERTRASRRPEIGQDFARDGQQDEQAVTNWLQSYGLVIEQVQPHFAITFSGMVAQVEAAFQTEIHNYLVNGKIYHANMNQPSIPRALSGLVLRVKGLDNPPVSNQSSGSAYSETVLYSFCSLTNCTDGKNPYAKVIMDSEGNLYSTAGDGGYSNTTDCVNGCGVVFELSPPATTFGTWTESFSYDFKGSPNDGADPLDSGLLMDNEGNLYGTTYDGGSGSGTVFELSPTGTGTWNETVLYNFGSQSGDGGHPAATLNIDNVGNLYGTTTDGGSGNGGTVFEMSPPVTTGGAWTETVLYEFCSLANCADGQNPYAGVSFNSGAANLFGTTESGGSDGEGTVFELSPKPTGGCPDGSNPGTGYCETVLHSFTGGIDGSVDGEGPFRGLIPDKAGNLYGTTEDGGSGNGGTVFEVSPPTATSGAWSETVLYNFCSVASCTDGEIPLAGLIIDSAGNLYGTTSSGGSGKGGTVFEVSPPTATGGAWSETVLYNFCSATSCTDGEFPVGGLSMDSSGNLYGATGTGGSQGGGTVYELMLLTSATLSTNALSFSGQLVGTTSTPQGITITNTGTSPLTITSAAITGTDPNDFAQTNSCGTSAAAGGTCTIAVTFTPTAPGARSASISITDNVAGSPQTVSLSGIGLTSPTITTTSLASGELGSAYSQMLQESGGTPPYSWSNSSGTLPSGLTLNTSGLISGTPTVAGTFQFTVMVTDANNLTATSGLLSIQMAPPPNAPTCPPPAVTVNGSSNPLIVNATTSCTDTSGTIASTSIAWGDGATTSATSGQHQYQLPGSYTVTVTATDQNGLSDTASGNVTVNAASTTSVTPGQSVQQPNNVTAPLGVPSVTVTYSCTSAQGPNGSQPISSSSNVYNLSCNINNSGSSANVTLTSTPTAVNVIVQTNSGSAQQAEIRRQGLSPLYSALLFLPGVAFIGTIKYVRKKSRAQPWVVLMVLGILMLGWSACGGGSTQTTTTGSPSTPSGTYSVNVTGTSSGGTESVITIGFSVGG